MKARCAALWAALVLCGCGEPTLTDPRCSLQFPPLPQSWETLLGEPCWQVEWVTGDGRKQAAAIQGGEKAEISLPQTWASPVSAAPFWPERGIGPGIFMPAGAIFPFDASGRTLALTWQGGVDAAFYWEMARHSGGAGTENVPPETDGASFAARAAVPRLPWNFDWPRFRRLFDDETVNAQVRADPWLADWGDVAARTATSGFDKRRLVPQARGSREIPVGPGPWIGTSPFAAPLYFEGIPVFSVRAAADTWVSAGGLLRCNSDAWIFLENR
ncbi:MAG: hypothetical protein LBQ69_02785 [Treponema sp.]|jgi:hypothetical protein|nr:hypothetical protein [Treponema sp.]